MKHNLFVLLPALVLGVSMGGAGLLVFAQQQGDSGVSLFDTQEVRTYSNVHANYAFKYPADWHIYEVPSMSYMRVENIDSSILKQHSAKERREYFKIETVVLPRNGLSLQKWVEHQNTTSYPLPKVLEQRDITVAEQPAIYQVEQFGSFVHPAVFVEKGDSICIINISSGDSKHAAFVDAFLKEFTFGS